MKRRSTRPPQEAAEAPVRLPLVQMTVQADGAMTVIVDGDSYAPPPYAPGWRREAFGTVLEAITARLGTPVKVQVVEYDGTTFTDVVMPQRRRTTPSEPAAAPSPELARQVLVPSPPVAVTGHGFLAGEDVAFAPIVACGSAAPDGRVNGVVAQDQIPAGVHEMVLIGRVSGTVQVVRATP